jgi:hypothetical protein
MSECRFEAQAELLEREFYLGIDRELIVEVQGYIEQHVEEGASTIPGFTSLKILSELQAAEITPKTLMAFSLFPSIHVAWSDGDLADQEKEAILKAAESTGVISGSPAYGLLNSWLNKKPAPELFSAWKDFVVAMRPVRDAASKRARNVAETAGGILGVFKISSTEEKALKELEQAFASAAQ